MNCGSFSAFSLDAQWYCSKGCSKALLRNLQTQEPFVCLQLDSQTFPLDFSKLFEIIPMRVQSSDISNQQRSNNDYPLINETCVQPPDEEFVAFSLESVLWVSRSIREVKSDISNQQQITRELMKRAFSQPIQSSWRFHEKMSFEFPEVSVKLNHLHYQLSVD